VAADVTLDRLLAGSPLRRPRVARRVLLALGCVLLLSVLMILLTVSSMTPEAVRYLDRRERESPWLFAIAILWGALTATGLAPPLNTGIIVAVDHWLSRHFAVFGMGGHAMFTGIFGAFLKWRVRCAGADPSTYPLVVGWRHEIAAMRA